MKHNNVSSAEPKQQLNQPKNVEIDSNNNRVQQGNKTIISVIKNIKEVMPTLKNFREQLKIQGNNKRSKLDTNLKPLTVLQSSVKRHFLKRHLDY